MDLAEFKFLLRDGRRWLDEVDFAAHDHLWWASELRRHLTPGQVNAVLETVQLREKGARKFSRASQMYFTRDALEQASGESIASYRASRIRVVNPRRVADLGCGIGGDALALAAHFPVIGLDRDLVRLQMARANHDVYGLMANFDAVQTDLLTQPPLPVEALFFDPARRDTHGRRFFHLHQYRPPLSILDRWRVRTPHQAVKISPGVAYDELPEAAEAEFISVQGELKECVLWFGGLRSDAARRATLLPGEHTLKIDRTEQPIDLPVSAPGKYLLEPDPAVIRAHLVGELGKRLDGRLISAKIAYLTMDTLSETPFGRLFAVETWFPFQLKRLKRFVREQGIGRVEVKKRGSPLDPNQLEKVLRGKGSRLATIFLTQVKGEPAVIVAHRL